MPAHERAVRAGASTEPQFSGPPAGPTTNTTNATGSPHAAGGLGLSLARRGRSSRAGPCFPPCEAALARERRPSRWDRRGLLPLSTWTTPVAGAPEGGRRLGRRRQAFWKGHPRTQVQRHPERGRAPRRPGGAAARGPRRPTPRPTRPGRRPHAASGPASRAGPAPAPPRPQHVARPARRLAGRGAAPRMQRMARH